MGKKIGVILILWGLSDFGLSWVDIDLYSEIGINVPDWLYRYTPMIPIAIGFGIYSADKELEEEEEEEV